MTIGKVVAAVFTFILLATTTLHYVVTYNQWDGMQANVFPPLLMLIALVWFVLGRKDI